MGQNILAFIWHGVCVECWAAPMQLWEAVSLFLLVCVLFFFTDCFWSEEPSHHLSWSNFVSKLRWKLLLAESLCHCHWQKQFSPFIFSPERGVVSCCRLILFFYEAILSLMISNERLTPPSQEKNNLLPVSVCSLVWFLFIWSFKSCSLFPAL